MRTKKNVDMTLTVDHINVVCPACGSKDTVVQSVNAPSTPKKEGQVVVHYLCMGQCQKYRTVAGDFRYFRHAPNLDDPGRRYRVPVVGSAV